MSMDFNLSGNERKSFSDVLEQEPDETALLRELILEYNKNGFVESEIPSKINPKHIPINPFPKEDQVDGYHSTL